MKARRLSAKFFVAPTAASVDLQPYIGLFHRFIQKGSVEGLLIDVADYAHVPEGPGVILIGHEVDYGLDLSGGRAGLLVTRKRCGELPLAESLRDTLRRALGAIRAIRADGGVEVDFATDAFEVQIVDRLAAPNEEESFDAVRSAIAAVAEPLFGEASLEIGRRRADDPRAPLSIAVQAKQPADVDAALERLGGVAAPAGDWGIEVEELKALRDRGAQFELVDVREPDEYEICNLEGKLIPLGSLPQRMQELDRSAHVIVHCKVGGRGAKAVEALRKAGFDNAWNLRGGILAWIDRIDDSLNRY